MTGLTLTDFSVTLGRRERLRIDRLNLPVVGFVGLVGPNGAGKSTLLKALAGVLPHHGTKTLGACWPRADQIGFMPQDFMVNAPLSVAECVLLGRREQLGWRISRKDQDDVDAALAAFGLSALAGERMDNLSGGQQQLVLLAQRLSRNPRLLILDEPTSALDLHRQIEVLTHLKATRARGLLVIAALHDLTLAARFADCLVMIENGRIRAVGSASEVLSHEVLDPVYSISSECLHDRDGNPVIVPHRESPFTGNGGSRLEKLAENFSISASHASSAPRM